MRVSTTIELMERLVLRDCSYTHRYVNTIKTVKRTSHIQNELLHNKVESQL